jgi:hypothetical protein
MVQKWDIKKKKLNTKYTKVTKEEHKSTAFFDDMLGSRLPLKMNLVINYFYLTLYFFRV